MTSDLRTLNLRERLRLFPPFLCFALTKVRIPNLTDDEKRGKYWNRENRELRRQMKLNGIELPRRQTHRRMTVAEMADQFPKELRWYVPELLRKTSWDTVRLDDLMRLLDICEIDILHVRNVHINLKKSVKHGNALWHLTVPQKREFAKCAAEWKKGAK
jgi:hypothetical protein